MSILHPLKRSLFYSEYQDRHLDAKYLYDYCIKNQDFVIDNSYMHCHAHGLHSLMLYRDNNIKIRLFISDNSDLYLNELSNNSFNHNLSIAFHDHRFNLFLKPIYGKVYDIVEDDLSNNHVTLNKYFYKSKLIGNGFGEFLDLKDTKTFSLSQRQLSLYEKHVHIHSDYHTVYVPKDTVAVWFIAEVDYNLYCFKESHAYSNHHPVISKAMYKKTTIDDFYYLMKLLLNLK